MTEEKTFFNESGVTVTNSRLVAGGETYAMSGVTSVKMHEEKPSRKGPIVIGIIGIGILFAGMSDGAVGGMITGVIIGGLGVLWWMKQKPMYKVQLRTASGEPTAYENTNKQLITGIVNAVNDAIVHRG